MWCVCVGGGGIPLPQTTAPNHRCLARVPCMCRVGPQRRLPHPAPNHKCLAPTASFDACAGSAHACAGSAFSNVILDPDCADPPKENICVGAAMRSLCPPGPSAPNHRCTLARVPRVRRAGLQRRLPHPEAPWRRPSACPPWARGLSPHPQARQPRRRCPSAWPPWAPWWRPPARARKPCRPGQERWRRERGR
jgi:hypothetical protein